MSELQECAAPPRFLARIWAEAARFQARGVDASEPHAGRAAHLDRIRRELPDVAIENEGATVYRGSLSEGCRACKQGAWDCVFVTMRCNLRCDFCCSRQGGDGKTLRSAYGAALDEVGENHDRASLRGVAFSGGEALLEPRLLLSWIAALRARAPDRYMWVYTNGTLASSEMLCRLADAGVNEIRFNMAATGYVRPDVLRNLRAAVRLLPVVTVEVPSVPDDRERLLEAICVWSDEGVRFLNLHELMRVPDSYSACLTGEFEPLLQSDGHASEGSLASRRLALEALRVAAERRLPLAVNECSLQSKRLQVRGRRRSLSRLVAAVHERLVGDELLESCCAFRNETDYAFVHPGEVAAARAAMPGYTFVRLRRTVPLSVDEPGRWVEFEPLV